MASFRIDTATGRKRLKPRKEPYWHRLAKREYLGYRKLADGTGRWSVRLTKADRRYVVKALKAGDELGFDAAAKRAREVFRTELAAPGDEYRLDNALKDYAKDLRIRKSATTAHDSDRRVRKHLSAVLLSTPVRLLTTPELVAWHNSMVAESEDRERVRKSQDSANRTLTILKAALNLAWRNGGVPDDSAWRRVSGFKDAGRERALFLTDAQVTALLAACEGGFRGLVEAAVLTGARYGELAAARVSDLDAAAGTIGLEGKTGRHDCFLSDKSLAFFTGQARGKLPAAYFFTQDDGTPWRHASQARPMQRAVRTAKLPRDCVFYSLRHYHISKALLAGIPAQVVAENCGTSVRMLERNYAKFMAADRRAMFNWVHGLG